MVFDGLPVLIFLMVFGGFLVFLNGLPTVFFVSSFRYFFLMVFGGFHWFPTSFLLFFYMFCFRMFYF